MRTSYWDKKSKIYYIKTKLQAKIKDYIKMAGFNQLGYVSYICIVHVLILVGHCVFVEGPKSHRNKFNSLLVNHKVVTDYYQTKKIYNSKRKIILPNILQILLD